VDGLADGRREDCAEGRSSNDEGSGWPVLDQRHDDPPGKTAYRGRAEGIRNTADSPVTALVVVGQRP